MSNLMNSKPFNFQSGGLSPQVTQALERIKPLINIANTSQDPQKTIKELGAKNPQINSILQMLNGQNPDAVLYGLLKSNGINPDDIANYLKRPV